MTSLECGELRGDRLQDTVMEGRKFKLHENSFGSVFHSFHCCPTKPPVLSSAMSVAHLSIEASCRKQAMPTLTWWSLLS